MDNRQAILDQSLKLFAAAGYDGVGVQQLVDACGVSKPTLYHYFGSKQGVLDSLVEAHFAPWFERLERAARYQGDLTQSLTEVVRSFFWFAQADPVFFNLQLSLWFSPPQSAGHKAVAPYLKRQHSLLEALFVAAVPQHGNLRGHQAAYAVTFPGMINATITAMQSAGRPLDEPTVHATVKLFMHGIYAL